MSVLLHDASQYSAFDDLLDNSSAPTITINKYKLEVLDVHQSSTGKCVAVWQRQPADLWIGKLMSPQRDYRTVSELEGSQRPSIRVMYDTLKLRDLLSLNFLLDSPHWTIQRRPQARR